MAYRVSNLKNSEAEKEVASSSSLATARFSALHPDIIESHILTRLDGPALASTACCCTALHRHSSSGCLWSSICHSTWPSTASPRVNQITSTFPGGGPQAFFSQAYPLLPELCISHSSSITPPELLSAVDIHHGGKLIFTKLQETRTETEWFRSSPFRIDLLDQKDVIPTPIEHRGGQSIGVDGMTLSWILIDPIGRRAANLSSHFPVTVQRHWLTGEIQAQFASAVTADQGRVQCKIVVTCGEGGGMQVREVKLEIEDMDGKHLNGKESLAILQGALEGGKGTGKRKVEEGLRRYREYEEMKTERRERERRREVALDTLCVVFGVLIFAAILTLIVVRK